MIAQKDLSIATKSIVNTDGSVIKAEGKLQLGKTMDEKGTVSGKMDSVVILHLSLSLVKVELYLRNL